MSSEGILVFLRKFKNSVLKGFGNKFSLVCYENEVSLFAACFVVTIIFIG
jgi:hypothetical protein